MHKFCKLATVLPLALGLSLSLDACVDDEFVPVPGRTPMASAYRANIDCSHYMTNPVASGAGLLFGGIGAAVAEASDTGRDSRVQAYNACMNRYGWMPN